MFFFSRRGRSSDRGGRSLLVLVQETLKKKGCFLINLLGVDDSCFSRVNVLFYNRAAVAAFSEQV